MTAEEWDSCLTIASGKSFTIDLNGHTLSRGKTSVDDNGSAIVVKSGGELTITDSSDSNAGKITSGYSKNGGAINNEGTLTIEGGTITENIASDKGGAIYNKGTLTVSGGCITNNISKDGGGIFNGGNLAADRFMTDTDNQLGWSNLSDSIRFNEINTLRNGKITIADDQAFTDGNDIYTGTLTSEQVDNIKGKTLTPYQLHHFDDPEWTWSSDYHHATALFKCADDDCGYTAEVDAVVTSEKTDSRIVYTATAEFNGETYTGTKIHRLSFFAGHSLSLSGDIGVNFYLDLTDEEAASATISFAWYDKTITNAEINLDPNGSGYYKASCPVAVAEMTYPITATLTIGDKTYTDTYSAVAYANVILTDPDFRTKFISEKGAEKYQQLRTLVKSMLDYGAKAQLQFHRDEENLANKDLTSTDTQSPYYYDPGVVTSDMISTGASDMYAGLPDGLQFNGSTIVYLSQTSLRLYYQGELGDVTVTFDGKVVEPVQKGSEFYFELKNVSAKDLDTLYTLKIGETEYRYSVLDYVKVCLDSGNTSDNMKALAAATYRYNEAANAYFG